MLLEPNGQMVLDSSEKNASKAWKEINPGFLSQDLFFILFSRFQIMQFNGCVRLAWDIGFCI